MSDTEDQSRAIARISTSQLNFEKSLKEKCMDCVLENAQDLKQPDCALTPALRRDFLEYIVTLADKEGHPRVAHVFSVVRLLLNERVTQFDFKVFGSSTSLDQETRDQQKWRLLLERCPHLTSVQDNRFLPCPQLPWELLVRLERLQHIKMPRYVCPKELLPQLVDAFPNLRSLAVTIKSKDKIERRQLTWLMRLQNLELLSIELYAPHSTEFQELAQDLLYQSVMRLPKLQEARVFAGEWRAFHNHRPEVLDRPLALTSLLVKNGFKGWTSERLPHVTKLELEGPLLDPSQFFSFSKLTVLGLADLPREQVVQLIGVYGRQLQELEIANTSTLSHLSLDPYELFVLCPNLKSLSWNGAVSQECRPDLFPLGANNFHKLRRFYKHDTFNGCSFSPQRCALPSAFLSEIFRAPHLESIDVCYNSLGVQQIQELSELLQRREILQHLREYDVNPFDERVRQCFGDFMQLVVSHCPRLTLLHMRHEGNRLFSYGYVWWVRGHELCVNGRNY